MFQRLREDIACILERDPAARSAWEVLTCYPGLHALVMHRRASWCRRHGLHWLARFISHIGRFLTGIEIHPGATIGRRLFIDHGMGVVIGETAELGDDVSLYQGVTLGGTGKASGTRHPTVGNRVTLGVGAKVLGAVRVGEGARIGGGAVVLRDVPPHTTAVGVPAHVIARERQPESADGVDEPRRLERLPDPEHEQIVALQRQVAELTARLARLEGRPAEGAADTRHAPPATYRSA